MRLGIAVGVLFSLSGLARADLLEPSPELTTFDTQVVLPRVPSFELPPAEPGFVDPKLVRVGGKKLLDTQVKVKGYIIWIYDCIADIRQPKETRKQTQKRIDDDPTLCERPKLYLGEKRDTAKERGLWIVDVPRPPNKLEKERLPAEELAAWPKVPKYKLGDFVVVTGDFKLVSPHSERNSDGLVVFAAIEPAKPGKKTSAAPVVADPPQAARKVPANPPEKAVDQKTRNASITMLNLGNTRARARDFARAIAAYESAVEIYDGNHSAWYGLGGAYAQSGDWIRARDAFDRAAALRPAAAMYQMWAGIGAYEAAVNKAKADEAAKRNVKPEEVTIDLGTLTFDDAREHLELTFAIEPKLWRACYYLGKIERAQDHPKRAAENLTQAIIADRRQPAPYIALAELYRKWDYTDEAIAVTALGTKELPQDESTSDVYYVLGMAYDEKRDRKRAIDAFTKALTLKPANYKATFQRGQAYFKLGKLADAKRDLEAFVAANAPGLAFAQQQAQQILADIAAKK